ncbi:MAG: hypothetical protein ACOX7H_08645 [Bacillota bacterium]|jgi:hypothetical protein
MTTQDILFWMDIQDELAKLMPLDMASEITRKLIDREDGKFGDIERLDQLNKELNYELQEYVSIIDKIRSIV